MRIPALVAAALLLAGGCSDSASTDAPPAGADTSLAVNISPPLI